MSSWTAVIKPLRASSRIGSRTAGSAQPGPDTWTAAVGGWSGAGGSALTSTVASVTLPSASVATSATAGVPSATGNVNAPPGSIDTCSPLAVKAVAPSTSPRRTVGRSGVGLRTAAGTVTNGPTGSNVKVSSTVDPPSPKRPGRETTSALVPSAMTSRNASAPATRASPSSVNATTSPLISTRTSSGLAPALVTRSVSDGRSRRVSR